MLVKTSYVTRVSRTRQPLINNILSPLPRDSVSIPIEFKFYNASMTRWVSDDIDDDDGDMSLIVSRRVQRAQETITDVPRGELLSDRNASDALFSKVLSRRVVPENERPVIIEKIFIVLESASTMQPFCVDISRFTRRLEFIRDRSDEMIQRATNESMDTYEVRPVPAAHSFIKDLERMSLNDSEAAKESTCVICMEYFDVQTSRIRLPCSHIFHKNCSVKWLMTSYFCPLCRYPMPCEEDLLAH